MASACGKQKPTPDALRRQRLPAAILSLPLILLPALQLSALPATETRVRVTAEKTSLRFQNSDNVESACEVQAGVELTALESPKGNWVSVAPPDDVSVWIYAELVHKGRIVRDKAQLRTGPGLSYKVIGSLAQNTAVEQRGRIGDWIKLKPPSGFSLWISRSAIAVVSTSATTSATVPTSIATSSASPTSAVPEMLVLPPSLAGGLIDALTNSNTNPPVATLTHATGTPVVAELPPARSVTNIPARLPPPPELATLPLTASPLQGCRDRFYGALLPVLADSTQVPAKHRIAGTDRTGGRVTFCYLLAPNAQLDAIPYGAKVTIEGPAWWLKGESVPVVKADAVTVDSQPER